jgi:predicted deacylase
VKRVLLVSALVTVSACGTSGREQTHVAPSSSSSSSPTATVPPSSPAVSATTAATQVWQSIGTSVQGRPLRLRRVGTGSRKVLWIGGIHGNEPEGAVATAALPAAFESAGLGAAVSLLIVEDVNPDGRAAKTRTNAHGVDLNRNFPARNFDASNPEYGTKALSQPESRALAALVVAERPQLVIACHSWAGASFINFDGPSQALATAFSAKSGMELRPSSGLGESTPGSLGTWLGQDLNISVLTIEWARGSDAAADWRTSRDAVLTALKG